jgi:membrane-bound lytic murein transglycosylase D
MFYHKYIYLVILFNLLIGQNSLSQSSKKPFMNTDDTTFLLAGNRITSILNEAKQYLSDAIIADVNLDTVEVVYNIKRIFDLLSDVDQIGVKEEIDKIEFEKFQTDFIKIYTDRLNTIDRSTQFLTADIIKKDIADYVDDNETVEMGTTKFTIIEDRAGHIPLVINNDVDRYIRYFQGKGRKGYNIWLRRYAEYRDMILPILQKNNLPEELIVVSMIESGFDPRAVSRAKAVGFWQFMYSTGEQYGLQRDWYVDERQDPEKSTEAAVKYFSDLYNEFGDWFLVLAAYNSGPGRVNRAIKFHDTTDFWQLYSLPEDTKNYIPYFMSSAIILKNPEKYGFKIPRNKPLTYDIVEVEKSADLSILAKAAESRLSVIKKLNPELRQPATPSNKVYQLKIPIGKKDIFIKNFNSIPDDEKFAIQRVEHRVGKGENLISIASKYRVSVADLQSINNITNVNKVYIGQKLKIPIKGGIYSNYPDKITYVVKSGDTLGHIAEDYKTRASEIRKWNNMGNSSSIYPGQKLTLFVNRITESSSSQSIEYIVKSGDSLIRIAEKYKVSVKQINEWNKLTSSIIYPGQKLKINTN